MCYLHGTNLRPDVCADCAREKPDSIPAPVSFQLTDTLAGHVERYTYVDARGIQRVAFRTVKPITRPEFTSRPWGQIWD